MKTIEEYLAHIDSRGPTSDTVTETLSGITFYVHAGVWNPAKGKSTKMFLKLLSEYPLENISSVLDMGTGAGILSLYLRVKGLKNIIAVDMMDEAIVNVKANIAPHQISEITVKKSDLFSDVTGTFDLILFNAPVSHPLRRNIPRILEPLWSPEENVRLRFMQQLRSFLTPRGRALVGYTKFVDYDPLPQSLLETFPFSYRTVISSMGDLSESSIIEIRHK